MVMNRRGFTLIELLIVIGLVGAMLAFFMRYVGNPNATNKANALALLEEGRQLTEGMKMYFVDKGADPSTKADLVPNYCEQVPSGWFDATTGALNIDTTSYDFNGDGTNDISVKNANVNQEICKQLTNMDGFGTRFKLQNAGGTTVTDSTGCTSSNTIFYYYRSP